MQRKLTVILSADVVGYSGLMERDESGTLARLKENRRSLFDPRVAAQGGRIFKVMGDGVLVEFPSATAAVTCALEIQTAMEAFDAHGPEAKRLRYRIGINLGDVIVEGEDMYGEGVNVAARLQELAPAGGVAVSRNVSDQVAGKVAATFEDLGPHGVKNIANPVHVFLALPQTDSKAPARTAKKPQASICVLPFANVSGDAEQEYFSDGITEDIITDLSKVSALWVAARNTSFMYKGKAVDVPQAARQLKVSHVLEGSVRKAGGRVRITAQLIDATGGHVWAERWDRELNDIFALQDEVSEAIVKALKLKLLPEEKTAIERRGTTNAEAYELFLLARQFERTGSERMKPVIVRICQRVVALDPGFARGWALMAMTLAELSQRGVAGYSSEEAREAAERAIAIDPELAEGYTALGEVLVRSSGYQEYETAKTLIDKAFAIDPNCYDAHVLAGYVNIWLKQYDESIRHFETACALDADAYRPAGMVTQAYGAIGDDERLREAARRCKERCERLLRIEPDHGGALGFFISSLADLGEAERAREVAKRVALFDPDNMRLRYNAACGMAKLGDADMAVDLLEPLIGKINPGWAQWIETDTSLEPIRGHPHFRAFCARLRAALSASLSHSALAK